MAHTGEQQIWDSIGTSVSTSWADSEDNDEHEDQKGAHTEHNYTAGRRESTGQGRQFYDDDRGYENRDSDHARDGDFPDRGDGGNERRGGGGVAGGGGGGGQSDRNYDRRDGQYNESRDRYGGGDRQGSNRGDRYGGDRGERQGSNRGDRYGGDRGDRYSDRGDRYGDRDRGDRYDRQGSGRDSFRGRRDDREEGPRGGDRFSPREALPPAPMPTEPPFKAFIGNVSYGTYEDELSEFLDQSCKVSIKDVFLPREGDKAKGFAIVEFNDVDSLKNALELNGLEFHGRDLQVQVAYGHRNRRSDKFGGDRDRDRDRRGGFEERDRRGGFEERDRRGGFEERDRRGGFDERRNGHRESDRRDHQEPPHERKKIELKPRSVDAPVLQQATTMKVNPFGEAKPRDELLFQRKKEEERAARESQERHGATQKSASSPTGSDAPVRSDNKKEAPPSPGSNRSSQTNSSRGGRREERRGGGSGGNRDDQHKGGDREERRGGAGGGGYRNEPDKGSSTRGGRGRGKGSDGSAWGQPRDQPRDQPRASHTNTTPHQKAPAKTEIKKKDGDNINPFDVLAN